eukprot:4290607-Prymnesium_polylepis.1
MVSSHPLLSYRCVGCGRSIQSSRAHIKQVAIAFSLAITPTPETGPDHVQTRLQEVGSYFSKAHAALFAPHVALLTPRARACKHQSDKCFPVPRQHARTHKAQDVFGQIKDKSRGITIKPPAQHQCLSGAHARIHVARPTWQCCCAFDGTPLKHLSWRPMMSYFLASTITSRVLVAQLVCARRAPPASPPG